MHPILSNKQALKGYLFGWVPLGLVLWFVIRVNSRLTLPESLVITIPLTGWLAFVCLSAWFVCRSLELTSTPNWKLFVTFLFATMCASAIVLAGTQVLLVVLNQFRPRFESRFWPAHASFTALIFVFYLLAIVLHYLVIATDSSQKAAMLSREAELKALKAQVNPHFLFNSLNSISALTTVDPARAREMCVALSDFLRSSLRLGEKTTIPLSEELALTRSYLDVERVRFGPKLRVRQEFATGCAECTLPPLLVQPLVENAIKHGIATLSEGGEIALTGERWNDKLRVTVENPFDPEAPSAQRNGFGLVSVRNRLQARYGSAGRLEIEIDRARYRVVLSLPWVST